MAGTVLSPKQVYGGTPYRDDYQPQKPEIIALWNQTLAGISGVQGGFLAYQTKALMDADLAHGSGTVATVYGDATSANNTIYVKSGASGSGAWNAVPALDDKYLILTNTGAGSANALQLTSSRALPATAYGGKFLTNVAVDNTGAVSIAINGGASKPLVTATGGAIESGYLKAGMALEFVDDGTNYRLTSDIAGAAIVAAAEAAQAAAEAAAAGASGAYPVPDRTALKALDPAAKKVAIIYDEDGRNGTFSFVSADMSAFVAADTEEGIYVAPSSDATGAAGAWVKTGDWVVYGVPATWFGAAFDYDPATKTGTSIHAAVNAAFALPVVSMVRLPAGKLLLADAINMPGGKKLSGVDRRLTTIYVNSGFNLDATGWLVFTGNEPSVEDLTFVAQDQPDSATLADYIAYPPVISGVARTRCAVRRVRMTEVYDGIDMTGNAGGWVIDDLELLSYNVGIDINGSLDSTKINKLHLWPFSEDNTTITANQRTVFADSYGIKSGKNDDFKLTDSLLFSVRKALYCYKGPSAADYTGAEILGTRFDDRGGLVIDTDGRIDMAACLFSQGKSDAQLLKMTGGTLTIAASTFSANAANGSINGFIEISGGAVLKIVGGTYNGASIDQQFIYAENSTLQIIGGTVNRATGLAFSSAFIRAINTRGGVEGLIGCELGSGSSKLVMCDTDSGFNVMGLSAEDWTLSMVQGPLKNIVTNNNVKSGGDQKNFTGYMPADGSTGAIVPPGFVLTRLGAGNYNIQHGFALGVAKDMMIVITPDSTSADLTAFVDYANSTPAALRVRTRTGTTATDCAFAFTCYLRRA